MNCPTDAALLLPVTGDGTGDPAVVRHVVGCPRCRGELDGMRTAVDAIRAADSGARSDPDRCLDELAIADLVEGIGGPGQRSRAIAHLAACGHCRRQVASVLSLSTDPAISQEVSPRSSPRRRWVAGAALLATAALLLLVALPRSRDPHRGPTITAGSVPTLLAPVGDVATAHALSWNAVPAADRYRATLFDASGRTRFELETTDTIGTIPDSVVMVPGELYLWQVEARTAWGRWVSSELTAFRLTTAGTSSARPTPPLRISLASFPAASERPAPDSLRTLARTLPDSALVTVVRARPVEVREALNESLVQAQRAPTPGAAAELLLARRMAAAYATAWNDPFLSREVQRFTSWSPDRRAAKLRADSTRRAGSVTFSRDGAGAAIIIWRRALAMARAIPDSAGTAAALGNIGAGFAQDDQPDSAAIYLHQARALAASIGDIRVEANATAELAGLDAGSGNIAGARDAYDHAIALRQRIGDSRGLAADYNNLAQLALDAGDPDEARRQLEAALTINRRDGRPEVAATNLVNLADLSSAAGDFALAEARYREALAVWRRRQQWADAADALRGLGDMEIRRGDYPAARADLREALAIYDRTGPLADALGVRLQLARARAAEGNLQGAIDDLQQARQVADSAAVDRALQASLALAQADLSVQLNLRPQAARLYASAELLYRRAGDRAGEAEARQGQGMLLIEKGDIRKAQELLEAALAAEVAAGDRRSAAITRIWLGQTALAHGDTAGARHQLATAATELLRLGDAVAAAAAQGQQASLELAAGRSAAAEALYRTAIQRTAGKVAPQVSWQLHAGLAATLRERGAIDAAASEWRIAIAQVQQASNALALPERRSGFLADKWDTYAQLALLERDRGRVSAAFDVSEQLRAAEMLEVLSQGRIAAPRDTAARLAAREQDLRRQVAELTAQLEGATTATGSPLRGPDLARTAPVSREALLQAQAAYADLLLEIREQAPRHAALVTRETARWREVAARLAPDQAFIEYLVSDEGTIAFVLARDTLAALPLGVGRRDLAQLVDFVRGTIEPRGTAGLDSLWRAPLRQLHRDLVAPIEAAGLLAGKSRLVIVPHAELHYLPFAALLGGQGRGQFLVERYQVEVTPSASIWLALGERHRSRPTAGVLAMAPEPAALAASQPEVESIGRIAGPGALILSGRAATEAAFRREAAGRRVIHLATIGVLNKQNPLFSFVEFAPDGANDGRLEVHEVFGLDLSADLVVLSACQTGLGSGALTDVPAGDDWVGLSRAFLNAGAGAVIATLWPVQDRASAMLMQQFYAVYLDQPDPGRALALAQRALLRVPATASPYYWAGFELVGGQ